MCAGEWGFKASQVSQNVEVMEQKGLMCDTLRKSGSVTEVSQAIVQGPKAKVVCRCLSRRDVCSGKGI